MIVNGRQIAKEIAAQAADAACRLPAVPVVRAITLAPNAATESYLATKQRRAESAGMTLELLRLPDDATAEEVIEAIHRPGAAAVLVQLPLPGHIDAKRVLDSIPVGKDADVLSSEARRLFENGAPNALLPPVTAAVAEIFERSKVGSNGKKAVVVGLGWLVGEPTASWLRRAGAEVVTVTMEESDRLPAALKEADIVVSGAGVPGLIQPSALKEGVVLIDAGTSESGGAIVGDADPACAAIAAVFTPVPGGVGPIAVACLFRNALLLAERDRLQTP